MVRSGQSTGSRHRRQRGPVGIGRGVLALVVMLVVMAVLVRAVDRPSHTAAPPVAPPATETGAPGPVTGHSAPAHRHWLSILDTIGRRRAVAWAQGRPEMLERVYTVGSAVLDDDRRLMAAYAARGLRVVGADLRFASVAVTRRAPGSVSLVVVDRLGRATAVDRAGNRRRLPRDLPTRHRIDLRLVGDQWRIARIALA